MADATSVKPILSVCATTASKVKDLSIKEGQLIFVHDTGKIALDFGSKRVFYNQIIELSTEQERATMLAPVSGKYYFVVETAVLWTYQSNWVQITTPTDATKVEKSSTNGNIKINGSETTVYTHPSGTNPHGTTASDIGLGNVNNTSDADKPISTAQQAEFDKINTELGKKISKEDGKSLIADTEIERLASVDNYDDTEIDNRIRAIEDDYIKNTDLAAVAKSGSYNDLNDKPEFETVNIDFTTEY